MILEFPRSKCRPHDHREMQHFFFSPCIWSRGRPTQSLELWPQGHVVLTKWKENESKVFYLDQEDDQVKSARYASYLAMGLAGIYIAKKALKW